MKSKHLFTQAATFWSFAFWSTLDRWWTLKRVCAWCKPPRWIGGNPFAKRVTHGICRRCSTRLTLGIDPSLPPATVITANHVIKLNDSPVTPDHLPARWENS